MASVEQPGLRRRPFLRQHRRISREHFALQMRQNSLDYRRVFNAGNDLDLTTAPFAGLDIDVKDTLEPLHPGHRLVALVRRLVQPVSPGRLTPLAPPAPLGRRYPHTKFAIGRENPVKARQICAWLRYQGRQLGNEVQRLKYDVRSPRAIRCLQLLLTGF
jgi:hypothetical protein